jgi:hypothetical protein
VCVCVYVDELGGSVGVGVGVGVDALGIYLYLSVNKILYPCNQISYI